MKTILRLIFASILIIIGVAIFLLTIFSISDFTEAGLEWIPAMIIFTPLFIGMNLSWTYVFKDNRRTAANKKYHSLSKSNVLHPFNYFWLILFILLIALNIYLPNIQIGWVIGIVIAFYITHLVRYKLYLKDKNASLYQ